VAFCFLRPESGEKEFPMAELIDVKELARRWGVPASFIYDRTCKNGPEKLPHYKIGKYVRFDFPKVQAWLAERERSDAA
jgi:excisionase family DNA binding protein